MVESQLVMSKYQRGINADTGVINAKVKVSYNGLAP